LDSVRFFVNSALLGEDAQGPPYAVEWVDENPFAPTEIVVEVRDVAGNSARDAILLEPFEIVESTQVASVLLEASVQDRTGRFVGGLRDTDFALAENGRAQAIDLVRPETVPSSFALLVDSSNSMSRRMDFVREAAGRLSKFLRPADRVLVVPFTKALGAVTGPTDDLGTIADAVSAIRSGGGTAILDALVGVSSLLHGQPGRHAVVLVTDGYDEHSEKGFDEALAALQATKVTVYVIAVGGVAGISLKGERFLRQIAAATGGRSFFPARENQLPTIHELVASEVQLRYLITYTPENQRADGTWRAVSLVTSDPALKVLTRPGYYAPKPAPVRPAIEFTIVDRERRYLEVTKEALSVLENGVPQVVESFQEAVDPVSIVLVLDQSGSMARAAEAAKAAARSFVEAIRPEDSLAVVLFSDKVIFAHDLTTNREHSFEAIDEYVAKGGTALYDALTDAMLRLKRVPGRKVVVVLSDGRDENNPGTAPGSLRTLGDVYRTLADTDATVFTIGLGPRVDVPLLTRLAAESGGESYFPQDVAQLATDYARVIDNLRRRYVISYTSTDSSRDGRWREVQISTGLPNTTVITRGGFYAPAR
jgi:Ca-activated chloride channel family protein